MRITYIARSFLDYRVPLFEALDQQVNGQLTIIHATRSVPDRVQNRLRAAIGGKAVGMSGERALGFQGNITSEFSNTRLRIPWQPGILKEIRKTRPDVLIGDGFSQWTLPALAFRVTTGTPLVVCYERTAHTERNAQWYRKAFRKSVLPWIDAMCVNGRLSNAYAQSLGVPAQRITCGHMVADVKNLSEKHRRLTPDQIIGLRTKLGIPLEAAVFLSVSKLIPLKGIAEFLQGWQMFSGDAVGRPHLLVVGDGPERENLELFCRHAELTNVTFAGGIDYDEIHQYYALADFFVISTLEDNWSLVVPEAMACGLPILCSIYNGCWPELVKNDVNGWIFDPLEITSIANVFQKASRISREGLNKMGRASREIVSGYTPESAAKAIFNACQIAIK